MMMDDDDDDDDDDGWWWVMDDWWFMVYDWSSPHFAALNFDEAACMVLAIVQVDCATYFF